VSRYAFYLWDDTPGATHHGGYLQFFQSLPRLLPLGHCRRLI